jgi:hypothetical protein
MSKSGKLYSNFWIRIAHDDFEKLVQIQKNYELKSVEEVFDLLVNAQTINSLAEEANDYAHTRHVKLSAKAS